MNSRSYSCIFILSVALLFGLPSPSAAETPVTPAEELETYVKKMDSYQSDLNDIAKGLTGLDQEIAIMLIDQAALNRMQITHARDFLTIESLLQDDGDKSRIKPFISIRIKLIANDIDNSIKRINGGLTYEKNNAVVTIATNLKDDLRALKELLVKF